MNSKRFIEAAEFPDFSRCRRFRTPRYPSIHSGRLRRSLMDSRQWLKTVEPNGGKENRMRTRDLAGCPPPRSTGDASPAPAWDEAETDPAGAGEDGGDGASNLPPGCVEIDEPGAADPPVGSIADVMTRMESCRRPVCRFYSARTRYPPIRRHRAPPRESPHALPYASISICTAHKLMRMPENKPSVAHERDDR
ncbi:hypothetical protein GIY62_22325 [Burkholderia plantarii]|uniref:hypothetical protein n=1 Tax=Burkholderia plantarii TaxID=41899 RepID=UPI00272AD06A|nr:hypothetical protein [Burkholderia plantarii]WLE63081.1 hypothetical protein GIY62_22325 [Burkholderia plantarii]